MIHVKLSRILGEKRITQAELSRMTGIRPATINELYHELAERVNLEHLDLICEALNCELSDLLERTPSPIPKADRRVRVLKRIYQISKIRRKK